MLAPVCALAQAIKLKPRFCDAYNNLASVHMHLGNNKQAIETYQMALMLNPGLVDAHSNLGNLYKAQVCAPLSPCCACVGMRVRVFTSILACVLSHPSVRACVCTPPRANWRKPSAATWKPFVCGPTLPSRGPTSQVRGDGCNPGGGGECRAP